MNDEPREMRPAELHMENSHLGVLTATSAWLGEHRLKYGETFEYDGELYICGPRRRVSFDKYDVQVRKVHV